MQARFIVKIRLAAGCSSPPRAGRGGHSAGDNKRPYSLTELTINGIRRRIKIYLVLWQIYECLRRQRPPHQQPRNLHDRLLLTNPQRRLPREEADLRRAA